MHNLFLVRCREISRLNSSWGNVKAQASNVGIGSGGYEGRKENDDEKIFVSRPPSEGSSEK